MALLRIVALLSLMGLCQAQPICSYGRLWNYLNLTTSNSFLLNFRPVQNWKHQTEVTVEMIIYGILKVDEMSQTVVAHTWTTTSWKNYFIAWDPKNFCDIDVVSVPRSSVWNPDLHITEDASDSSSTQQSPFVNLYSDGWASTSARQLLTFTCQFDLSMYPFDKQECNITFSSMTSNVEAILLITEGNGTQMTNASKAVIITQGEWDLKNIRINTNYKRNFANETYSQLVYTVNLTRRPMLYVINFIVPLFYFLILDLASFFINEAGGEKLSFKVTILLSISVLLLILKDMLPSTERQMPWIANYCVGIFALVGISVLEAMAISFLLSFPEKVKKDSAHRRNCEDEIQLERTDSKDPLVLTVAGELTKSPPSVSAIPDFTLLRPILREVQSIRDKLVHDSDAETRPRFWKLARILDIMFFVLYFLVVIVFLTYLYLHWAKLYFEDP